MSIKKVKTSQGESWGYDIRVVDPDGSIVRRRDCGFATRAECERAAAARKITGRQIIYGLYRPEVKHTTVGEAVERYLRVLTARWEMERGKIYADRNVGQTNALKRWVEFTGEDRHISTISNDDLVLWAQHEKARELSPATIQRRMNTIRAALRHAHENNADLVTYRIPKSPRIPNADQPRTRLLEDHEIAALSAVLSGPPPRWRKPREKAWRDAYDFFRIALTTGGRCQEILNLKWVDVNYRFGTVLLISTKTGGKTRTLNAPAAAEIIRARKDAGLGSETYVFTVNDHSIRDAFRAASKLCKISYGQRVPGGMSLHDLRRTCLTNLLMEGVDLATVRDFAGHYSIAQTSRYVHPTMKSRARIAEASSKLIRLATTVEAPGEKDVRGDDHGKDVNVRQLA